MATLSTAPRSTRHQVRGDLRPVTILFADVRGFTRLSEVLPAEQLVAAINQCFEALDEPIARYGGEVDKFMGDAIMATFGAPAAHADDPRRAVLAALEMQRVLRRLNRNLRDTIGHELEMRIGVNTGMVVAGPIGSRRKQAYTVMGDAVNVAARLEHAAPPGGVVIGESTRAALGASFRVRARRTVRVRGREAPVRSYVVLGQASDGSRRAHANVPFVGRTAEYRSVRRAIAPLRRGRPVMLRLVGEMGVGKTRIVQETVRRLAQSGIGYTFVSCPPYGQDLPYATLASLLRAVLFHLERAGTSLLDVLGRAADQDGLDPVLASGVVHDLIAGDVDDRRPEVQAARRLPAKLRKGLLARATKLLLREASLARPHLLVLDDCHWLDTPSQTILGEAAADLASQPIGWVLLSRPGWQPPVVWAAADEVEVRALQTEDSIRLALALLGSSASPTTGAFIAERAEGNPLLLRELAATFAETDLPPRTTPRLEADAADSGHLNAQLRSLILARVDGLDERSRRVLQVASVLGHTFPSGVLRRMLGPGEWNVPIEHLVSSGLLERQTSPRADGAAATWTWQFRHPLVQETVYATLLASSRGALHLAAGEAIESTTTAQVPDRAALLALHFARTDDHHRAITYLCMAGDRARSLYLNHEAIHYYDGVLARLDRAGGEHRQRAAVLVARAETQAVLAQDAAALESFRQAIDISQQPEQRAELWVRRAEIHRRRGEFGLASQELSRAEEALGASTAVVERARVQIGRAMLAFDSGAFGEAQRLGYATLDLLAGKDAPHDEAAAWRAVGLSLASSSNFPSAVEALGHARDAAQRARDAMLVAAITSSIGLVRDMQGRYDEAGEAYRESLAFYERVGAKRQIAGLWINLGALVWMHGEGDWHAAQTYWLRAVGVCEEIGDRRNLAEALANLAEGLALRGERDLAGPHLERALVLARDLGRHQVVAQLERLAAA